MIHSLDASLELNELYESHFPNDFSSGTSLVFVFLTLLKTKLLKVQKAPLLRVIDANRLTCSIEPTHRKNFTNLD